MWNYSRSLFEVFYSKKEAWLWAFMWSILTNLLPWILHGNYTVMLKLRLSYLNHHDYTWNIEFMCLRERGESLNSFCCIACKSRSELSECLTLSGVRVMERVHLALAEWTEWTGMIEVSGRSLDVMEVAQKNTKHSKKSARHPPSISQELQPWKLKISHSWVEYCLKAALVQHGYLSTAVTHLLQRLCSRPPPPPTPTLVISEVGTLYLF